MRRASFLVFFDVLNYLLPCPGTIAVSVHSPIPNESNRADRQIGQLEQIAGLLVPGFHVAIVHHSFWSDLLEITSRDREFKLEIDGACFEKLLS